MSASSVNKIIGNRFEAELCEILAQGGWWAHNMAQNQAGQPADIIAAKGNIPVLIDCKVCETDRFPLSRIEENQENAMYLWLEKHNSHCYFALKFSDGSMYMVSFHWLMYCRANKVKSLSKAEIELSGMLLSRWMGMIR